MSSQVKVEELRKIPESLRMSMFEFVFIDHDKNSYLSGFLLLKEHGLIGKRIVNWLIK